jgi:hypothetical protein
MRPWGWILGCVVRLVTVLTLPALPGVASVVCHSCDHPTLEAD